MFYNDSLFHFSSLIARYSNVCSIYLAADNDAVDNYHDLTALAPIYPILWYVGAAVLSYIVPGTWYLVPRAPGCNPLDAWCN